MVAAMRAKACSRRCSVQPSSVTALQRGWAQALRSEMICRMDWPRTSVIVNQSRPSGSSPLFCTATTEGWRSCAVMRASWWKRRRRESREASSGRMIFMASTASSLRSWTRRTSPMAPTPMVPRST